MRKIKLLLTLLLISGFSTSNMASALTAGPCDKERAKRLLQIPFDTVGLRSMSQVNAVRKLLGCNEEDNGPFEQAFQEVTGESLKQFASRSGSGMSSDKSGFPVTSGDLFPESSLTYKTRLFSTIPVGVQVYQLPVKFDETEIMISQTGTSSVELVFASDPENLSHLDVYVNQYQQIEDGNLVRFARKAQNEFCLRIRKGFDFRMAGICLLKAVVKLPANSNIQVIDENGIRVNDSSLPFSKSEFFNALEDASVGEELRVVRQYAKSHYPQDKLNKDEVVTILSSVSIDEEIDALKAIYPMLAKPISVDFSLALLDKVSVSDQLEALKLLLRDFPINIAPRDIGRLLDEVSFSDMSDRLEAFKLLAPLVGRNQRAELFEVIDDELGISDGKIARRFLLEMPQ